MNSDKVQGMAHPFKSNLNSAQSYTAVIKQDGPWWFGWIEEIPGVNCQETTQDELLASLKEALRDALLQRHGRAGGHPSNHP